MNQENKKQFAFLMAKLEEVFSEPVTKEKIALYFDYLNDLSVEQISRAVDFLIKRREKRGIPTIAEIRSATLGSMEYKAVEAWGELLEQTYKPEKIFRDSVIPKAVKIAFGDLDFFYQGNNRNEMADRAHFIKTYQLVANLEEVNTEYRKKIKAKETRLIEEAK